MKVKDLLSEEEVKKIHDLNECAICKVHESGYQHINDAMKCPWCEHEHNISDFDFQVVGETNFYSPNQLIHKYPITACLGCGNNFALMPQKIQYNGNHDIYYTGGDHYLPDDCDTEIFNNLEKKIKDSLDNWIERYESGEKLNSSYPATWIRRDITEAIAKYLYDKGFKK